MVLTDENGRIVVRNCGLCGSSPTVVYTGIASCSSSKCFQYGANGLPINHWNDKQELLELKKSRKQEKPCDGCDYKEDAFKYRDLSDS